MSKTKLFAIGLLAIALLSIPVLADYIDSITFSTYYSDATLTVQTLDGNYTEIYFEDINGIPVWITTTFNESGSQTCYHEGGGGGGGCPQGCGILEEKVGICVTELAAHSVYITVQSLGLVQPIVEFWIEDEIKDNHYYFEIEAKGGIEEAPDTSFIENDGTRVARVKLLKD